MADLESMTKKELESYAKEQFDVDLARNLSKENMIREIQAMQGAQNEKQQEEQAAPAKAAQAPKAVKDVPPETLEAAVQVAALLHGRDGADPAGEYLLRKCGQVHVDAVEQAGADPEEVATWACEEARRRSPSMEHKAIVAQRMA